MEKIYITRYHEYEIRLEAGNETKIYHYYLVRHVCFS